MRATRELVAGWGAFAACIAAALALAAWTGSPTLRALSLSAGVAGAGAMGVFAALFAHTAGRPMRYEPVPGAAGAWGFSEAEEEPGLLE